MKVVGWLISVGLGLLTSQAHAVVMDLKQAIDYALSHHIDLKIQEADREVRWHELSVLQQKFSPQFDISMSGTIHHEDYFNEQFDEKKLHVYPTLRLHTPIGTIIELFSEQNIGYEAGQRKSGASFHITMEQPLLRGRSRQVNTWSIDSALLLEEVEKLAYQKTIENIIYHVMMSYYNVFIQAKKVEIQQSWLDQAMEFYRTLQARWEAGRIASSDLHAARLQVMQAQIHYQQVQLDLRQANRVLEQAMGWEGEALALSPIREEVPSFAFEQEEQWRVTALENDLESQIREIQVEKLRRELIVAKDQRLYELNWRANATVGRYHVFGNSQETFQSDDYIYAFPFIHRTGNYSTELQLTIPITGKAARNHQVLAINMALLKLEQEQTTYQKNLGDQITHLVETAALLAKQKQLLAETVSGAKHHYQNALLKYEAGRISLFEVERQRDKWQEAQQQFFSQEITFYNTVANVELHAGLLAKKWLS